MRQGRAAAIGHRPLTGQLRIQQCRHVGRQLGRGWGRLTGQPDRDKPLSTQSHALHEEEEILMKRVAYALLLGAAMLAAPSYGQEASTVGAAGRTEDAATGGTGGSATAGSTSASTLGVGATSGDSSAIGVGGSAASPTGRNQTRSHVNPTANNGQAMAQSMDKGTFSKSHTHVHNKKGQVRSRTKSMSHVPGSKPVMSTTTSDSGAAQ